MRRPKLILYFALGVGVIWMFSSKRTPVTPPARVAPTFAQWQEIQTNPEFLALPKDTQRQVRLNFFNDLARSPEFLNLSAPSQKWTREYILSGEDNGVPLEFNTEPNEENEVVADDDDTGDDEDAIESSFSTPKSKVRFLGTLNANRYDPNSVSNPYGQYGSRYSPDSIHNPYGAYGSRFAPNSANNPYTTGGPRIIDPTTGEYLGTLNSNKFDPDSVSNPYGRYGSPYSPDSINNPYGKYGSPYSPNSANNPYSTSGPAIIAPDDD